MIPSVVSESGADFTLLARRANGCLVFAPRAHMIGCVEKNKQVEDAAMEKPSYIGVLNAIANAEAVGHKILKKWAEVTTCDDIRGTLQMVAIREAEHAWAFEKRLCELGFGLKPKEFPDLNKQLKIAKSDLTDVEKFERLGYRERSEKAAKAEDDLLPLLADKSIDPQTGALLGRFICEERDSARKLQACYLQIKNAPKAAMADTTLDQVCSQLAVLTEKVEAMSRLKAVR
jgi:rubrerythrin